MRVLRAIGLLDLLERILSPVLPVFGMGNHAAPVTVVGMVMGLGYGGAMIIRETARGKMDREEVFHSMAMMGLCHGLVEDTLLMVAIGGRIAGIFWGRIFFSLLVVYGIVRCGRFLAGRRMKNILKGP
jgi:spore maturation protein SpmB